MTIDRFEITVRPRVKAMKKLIHEPKFYRNTNDELNLPVENEYNAKLSREYRMFLEEVISKYFYDQ